MDTTLNDLLGHRVTLEQFAQGYRVAVDTVLLAAAVPAQAGQTALDLGCGVGGAMLCLACRVPGISVMGLEIQPELAVLCRNNIGRNAFKAEMKITRGDVTRLPLEFVDAFDHALMNPPYHDETRHDFSPDASKRTANTEKPGDLVRWIGAAAMALKDSGILTLIHRADRRDEILAHMGESFGPTEILPILPKADTLPRRVIIRAKKGGQPSVRQCKNLILHSATGGYSEEAESILRHMKPMDFVE